MIAQQFAIGAVACFEYLRLIKAGEKIEAHRSMSKPLSWIHVLSWICNIIIGAYLQFKDGSSPPRYIGCGMYRGGFDPIIGGIVIGSIPVVSTAFVIYAVYNMWLKRERL